MNFVPTNVKRVWNGYFSRHSDRGSRNGNEAQRKGGRGIPPSPHCTRMVNQSLPRVLRQQSSINEGIMCMRISPSASSYGRKAKPPTMTMTSSQTQKRKCYGQMWNDTLVFRRSTNNYLRIGSWRRWLLRFRRSRKTWTKTTLKRASLKESTSLLGCICAIQIVRGQRTAQAKENVSKKKHFHHLGQGGYKEAIPKWQKMEEASLQEESYRQPSTGRCEQSITFMLTEAHWTWKMARLSLATP